MGGFKGEGEGDGEGMRGDLSPELLSGVVELRDCELSEGGEERDCEVSEIEAIIGCDGGECKGDGFAVSGG